MLPPRYADWISRLLEGTLPEEQAATCDRCVMQTAAVPEGYRFRADTKCCTYVPALPNYLVGAALRELPPGPGRASLEARLADRSLCTPHGLDVDPADRQRYAEIVEAEGFGRAPGLRCPHYLLEAGGQCGIWRHRNGVCATWYCKHDRGAAGQRLWRAVEAVLSVVERELCHWCACQVLFHGEPPGALADDDDDDPPEWQAWVAHAPLYYQRTAEVVDELSWSEVQAIAGAELGPALAELQAAYADLRAAPVPRALVPGLLRISHRGPSTTRVVTYSDSDALDLPSEIVALLPRFDGRATEVVLAELAAEGVILTAGLVARLVDFAILQQAARRG